jgi:hypothetical protein
VPLAQAAAQAAAQAKARMRKSSSEPNVRLGHATTGFEPAEPAPRAMRGGVLLRGAPAAAKAMRVDFEASLGALRIFLRQDRDGVAHDFVLFTLDLATLFVGWDSGNPDMFVIGAQHQDMVFHPIYCYPCTFSRNRWLWVFEDSGCAVTSMVRTSACENDGFRVLSRIGESSGSL